MPADRIWIESKHTIAFAADTPAAEGHIVRRAEGACPEHPRAADGGAEGRLGPEVQGGGFRAAFE